MARVIAFLQLALVVPAVTIRIPLLSNLAPKSSRGVYCHEAEALLLKASALRHEASVMQDELTKSRAARDEANAPVAALATVARRAGHHLFVPPPRRVDAAHPRPRNRRSARVFGTAGDSEEFCI